MGGGDSHARTKEGGVYGAGGASHACTAMEDVGVVGGNAEKGLTPNHACAEGDDTGGGNEVTPTPWREAAASYAVPGR